jgi:WD40 repeat protein
MRLAPFVWRDDRSTAEQLRTLLARQIPEHEDISGAGPKPDLRGFEWYYHRNLLEISAAVFSGHDAPVVDAAFTEDGQLVTLDENSQTRRWNLDSQEEAKTSRRDLPGGHKPQANFGNSGQFRVLSPNGKLAALAEGNKVRMLDTGTGKETCSIVSANTPNRRLIISRDSDRLVIVDDRIRWLSATSGGVIAAVNHKFPRVNSLALSADGLTLAVAGGGPQGNLFSVFRLDTATRSVTALAKDAGFAGTILSVRVESGWPTDRSGLLWVRSDLCFRHGHWPRNRDTEVCTRVAPLDDRLLW